MQAKSVLLMQDPDETQNYMKMADIKPSLLLEGRTPRLIDEWQMAPVIWDAVRYAVDKRGETGQFILTGSTLPLNNEIMHSGTGRISRIVMRTMSLFESGESNGQVSLAALFDGADLEGSSVLDVRELAFLISRGGWPGAIGMKEQAALQQAENYLNAIVENDISEVDNVSRDPIRARMVLRSLARNIATTASLPVIQNDVDGTNKPPSTNTVVAYLNGLERLFVIENQPAWSPALRSRSILRKTAKRHFIDPSIAVAALKTNPDGLLKDLNTLGFLFESLCIRDLRIYAQVLKGNVLHYQDNTGLESDAIIALHDGRWGAVEVKLGQKNVDEAAENLLKLKDRIDEEKSNPPSFLMVLTGNGY
ncbi:MAG: DUF4143 domain-containing protein, partial [Peptostreptococcaceae bacterium]|nr:DUF4143 domain-containing protein [Peptostreptococcaceae bacterium]